MRDDENHNSTIQVSFSKRTLDKLTEKQDKNPSVIEYLYKNRFRISKTGISYRKANYLYKAGLLPSNEIDNATNGWRRFNFKDVMYLDLLIFIQKFGVKNEQLKPLLDLFYDDKIDDVLLACGYGIEMTLLLFSNGSGYVFDPEMLIISENNELFEWSNGGIQLRINLNYYFNRILEDLGKLPVSTHRSLNQLAHLVLQTENLTENERKILTVIRDNDVERITIKKQNGKPTVLYAQDDDARDITKSDFIDRIRDLNYGDVTFKVRGGKVVNYIKEATTKLD